MTIEKAGTKSSKRGPSEWFTGTVWIDEIAPALEPSRVHVLRVFFEPGARTAWHSHPLGQTLHVLAGVCRAQKSGESPVEAHPGDTLWIAPGERHWHGAAPGQSMIHLAVQQVAADGTEATWFEHVSQAEYAP